MAKTATTRSDVLEQEYEAGFSVLIPAIVLLLIGALCFWPVKLIANGNFDVSSPLVVYLKPLLTLAGIVCIVIALIAGTKAGLKMGAAKGAPIMTIPCPYCKFDMRFVTSPTTDYDCEGCHRRVLYENGKPVAIREVTCNFCKTPHRVAVTAKTLICDQCNRPVRLIDPKNSDAVVTEQSDMLLNYDVKLTDIGRNKNEVAMALQSILICNLPEARRQMENLPLTLARNIPERKADSYKRKLRELGATAVVVVTESSEQAKQRQ